MPEPRLSGSQVCSEFERPFCDRAQLFSQLKDVNLPITRLSEPGKCLRECRIGPATGQPCSVVNHAQRSEAFDQHQLATIERCEVSVALEKLRELLGHFGPITRKEHPQILDRRTHDAIVKVNKV